MLVIICLGKNENICIPSGLDPSRGQEELSTARVHILQGAGRPPGHHRGHRAQTDEHIHFVRQSNVSAFMRKPSATWKRANLKSTHRKKLTKSRLIRNVFKSGSISWCFMTFSHEVCIHSPALLSLQNDKCPRASLKYLHHFQPVYFSCSN